MIHVLDDMKERVDALASHLAPGVPIAWSTTVRSFCAYLQGQRPLLVILDHDLGPGSATHNDRYGHSGMDAALYAPIPIVVPVLVWSCNGAGRPAVMRDVLRARGLITAEAHRFGTQEAKTFIRSAIRGLFDPTARKR